MRRESNIDFVWFILFLACLFGLGLLLGVSTCEMCVRNCHTTCVDRTCIETCAPTVKVITK